MRAVSPYLAPPRRRPLWLEPLAVALVLALAAGVVWLNLRDDAPQVNAGARALAQDLLLARSEAVRLSSPVSVVLEPDGTAYYLLHHDPHRGETTLLRREFAARFPLVGVAGSAALRFDARGHAEAGALLLHSVQDERFGRCVQVASDGRVSLEDACAPGATAPVLAYR